jgi:SAM-dependent methyltransferase
MNVRETGVCAVLRSRRELVAAEARARKLGLPAVPDSSKYWDNVLALEAIEGMGIGPSEPIVDLGCRSGIILTWLDSCGYRCLYGCDLRLPVPPLRAAARTRHWGTLWAGVRAAVRHRKRLRRSPVEQTGFATGVFSAATCMSVVEHGVNIPAFFAECSRLLRPRGLLVLSTDYWPTPIDVAGLTRFASAGPDRIFDRDGVLALCEEARRNDLFLANPINLDADDRVIEADGFQFTFLALAFRRGGVDTGVG